MEVIIKSYLDKFVNDFELDNNDSNISYNFELFSSYVIVSNILQNPSLDINDIESMNIGSNKGIDSIAIIVNNKLVTNTNELKDFFDDNKSANIEICFIQSKTSKHFEDSELSNFADTIIDFLKESPAYALTTEAANYHEMLLFLYSKLPYIPKFKVSAFYTCLGNWTPQNSVETTRKIKEKNIADLHNSEFSDGFSLSMVGENDLRIIYNKISNPLHVELKVNNSISLDNTIDGIKEAYIALLPFNEFKKIIIDSDTGRIRNLFYDNLRDDLGIDNPVNAKISKTLSDKKYLLFPLLNNGVTIIAEKNSRYGNNFSLENFQIVNGCQTSYVISTHINDEGIEDLLVPIKLIITENEDIRDDIIVATNSQTAINNEQLLALTQFQKDLEQFYITQSDELYYERRVNQYKNSNIKQKNIVTLREQIKTYAAICKDVPHLVSGYFGKIYKLYEKSMFLPSQNFESYYFSALLQYKFKDLIARKLIDRKYNKLRYHIFMLYKMFFGEEIYNEIFLNKNRANYFKKLILTLRNNDEKIIEKFHTIFTLIDSSGIDITNQKEIYKQATTDILRNKYYEITKANNNEQSRN